MSTLKTTNLRHESSSSNNIVLDSTGKVTVAEKKFVCPGTVIQVQSITKTDTATSGSIGRISDGVYWDYTDSSLKLSITPTATSSKILVTGQVNIGSDRTNITCIFQLMRDGSAIGGGSSPGSRTPVHSQTSYWSNTAEILDFPIHFLDSPSTTSAVEYNARIAHSSSTNTIFYINRSHPDTNDYSYTRTVSTITAMEIAG